MIKVNTLGGVKLKANPHNNNQKSIDDPIQQRDDLIEKGLNKARTHETTNTGGREATRRKIIQELKQIKEEIEKIEKNHNNDVIRYNRDNPTSKAQRDRLFNYID